MTTECEVGSWTGSQKDNCGSGELRGKPGLGSRALPHGSVLSPALSTLLTWDANVRGRYVKGMWQLSVLFLQIFCKSKITWSKFLKSHEGKVIRSKCGGKEALARSAFFLYDRTLSPTPSLSSRLHGLPPSHTDPLGGKIKTKPKTIKNLEAACSVPKSYKGKQHLETFTYKNAFPPFSVQELPFWHCRRGLVTHRTVTNRMSVEKEEGHVKRTCIMQERRIWPVHIR